MAHLILGRPSAVARVNRPDTLFRVESVSWYELHPTTEPDAIRRTQCRVVREAMAAGHTTVESLSDACDLPAFSIRSRLADMGVRL